MKKMQQQMLQSLPADQRAQMQAQIDANDPANGRMCMTAQQAKAYSDPKAVMQEMQKQAPVCTLTAQSVSKMSVQFLGQCKATPDNPYTGTFTGEYVYKSAREASGT